jgi:hypothetical protein
MLADDFIGCVALDALCTWVPGRGNPILVKLKDRVVDDGLDKPAITPFAFQQILLRLLPLGDVTSNLCKSDDFAAFIECRRPGPRPCKTVKMVGR